MHDIDRTQLELYPEMESFEQEQFEFSGEQGEQEVFNEAELMELASELLEVGNEQELDRFLGNLVRKAGSALGRAVRSPIGQAIGGALKGLARKALPLAGTALGGFVGGPLGAKIGSGLASAAGSALGLEAETLQQEDREFEGARQFVRMAGTAVKNAATASPGTDPRTAAQSAAIEAARALAPGLLQSASTSTGISRGMGGARMQSGRWIRRGSKIILFGV